MLVAEFRTEVERRGLDLRIDECDSFADLWWPPHGDGGYLRSRSIEDPAFKVVGSSRYVAFARILDEIRFWAAPSSNASAEASQMGVLRSVDDAVALASRDLEG